TENITRNPALGPSWHSLDLRDDVRAFEPADGVERALDRGVELSSDAVGREHWVLEDDLDDLGSARPIAGEASSHPPSEVYELLGSRDCVMSLLGDPCEEEAEPLLDLTPLADCLEA